MSTYVDGKRAYSVWPEVILLPVAALLLIPYIAIVAFSLYCNGDLP